MTPYADFAYFGFLLYPLAALVVLGTLGWLRRPAVLLVSLAVLLVEYADPLGLGGPIAAGLRPLGLLGAAAAAGIVIVLAYAAARRRWPGTPVFVVAVLAALTPLVAAKLAPDGFAFLGVSYMTLRVLDAIIVLHDGDATEMPSVGDVTSYLLFLPTISAGPIDRFRHFTRSLDALPRRGRDYLLDVDAGVRRIAQGFLYKFIVAALIEQHALAPLATRTGVLATAGYMYAYSAYLFFDFAGYSAFAIGVGHFFGVRVPENFRAPFLSRNFREMWDRWHITLSWWLRDHVYMRLMKVAVRRRWFGGNRVRAHHVALLATMGLMGCWHGLRPQYLVYGLYQGLMLVAYDVGARWNERHALVGDGPWVRAGSVFLTANLFCFGLLIFSGRLFSAPVAQSGSPPVAERVEPSRSHAAMVRWAIRH